MGFVVWIKFGFMFYKICLANFKKLYLLTIFSLNLVVERCLRAFLQDLLHFLGYFEPYLWSGATTKKSAKFSIFKIQLIIVWIIERRDLEGFSGLSGSCDHGFIKNLCSFLLFCRIGMFSITNYTLLKTSRKWQKL